MWHVRIVTKWLSFRKGLQRFQQESNCDTLMLVWIEVILDAGSGFILLKEFDDFAVIQVMSSVGSYYHTHHGFSGNLKILPGVLRVWKGMPVFWADGTANKCPDASCERCCTISGEDFGACGPVKPLDWSKVTTLEEPADRRLSVGKTPLNHSFKQSLKGIECRMSAVNIVNIHTDSSEFLQTA